MSRERRTYDPVREEERARRLAVLKAENETRWRDLFNRQQSERDPLFEPGLLNSVRSAAFIYRALKREYPDASLSDFFNVMASQNLQLELAGRHQLQERKALHRANMDRVGKLHRELETAFAQNPDRHPA